MGMTESKRQVQAFSLIGTICLTTALALGQDQVKPAVQLEWAVAKWQSAPFWNLDSRPVTNRRALSRPRDATSLTLLNPLRTDAINSGVGFPNLKRSAASAPAFPPQTGSWTGRVASLLSGRLTSVAAPSLTYTCPSGGTCWVGGASGVWSNSANWSNGVPTSNTNALIDNNNANGQGASAVTLDIAGAANNLTVDSDDSLTISDNHSLTVSGGSISDAGKITVNSAGNTTALKISGNVTLAGSGTLTMSNNANNLIVGASGGGTEVLTTSNTIQGAGNIGDGVMGLVNNGAITANQSNPLLVDVSSKNFTNNGTLSVNSGDLMRLEGGTGTFTNFSGSTLTGGTYNVSGTLKIDQLGSTGGEIVKNAANITLNGAASSLVDAAGNNALSKLSTNPAAGGFTITGGRNFTTGGSFTNYGTLTVGASNSKFDVNGNLTNFNSTTDTLAGGTYNITGALQFNSANIVTNDANITLTSTSSQIVDQNGANGLANFATNDYAGSFTINSGRNFTTPGNFTNNGTLTVGSSNSKFVVNGSLTNFDSTYNTLVDGTYNLTGTLQFNGANIVTTDTASITLSGTSSQIVNQSGANALANFAVNDDGSIFTINSGRNFTTAGIFTNNGTLTVGSSNSKFVVNGSLTNFSGTTLTGGIYNLTGTLQFNGANIVTNAADITLTGTSSQIIDQNSHNGLANFATNASSGSFSVAGGRTFTTSGAFTNNGFLTTMGSGSKFSTGGSASFTNTSTGTVTTTGGDSETATGASGSFTNNGTLEVDGGSTFFTGGSLSNFSGTTLKGGTYNVSGTFQFPGANIVTNAANITLTGASSQILNSNNSANGLANFVTNASTGVFSLQGGRSVTTPGAFSNAGTLVIGSGSTFTVGGTGMFTQTAGTTTNDGTLTLKSSGTLNLKGGSMYGTGSITGAVTSSGTVTPGDILKPVQTGILGETGAYTQNSGGTLDILIQGTKAGSQYDQLNATTASLNGTLNINLHGFVPNVGTKFKIMNFNSASGQFSTVNGLAISMLEHFTITYQANDVLLTVAAGPCCGPQFNFRVSTIDPTYGSGEPGRFGLVLYGRDTNLPQPNPRMAAMAGLGSPLVRESLFAPYGTSTGSVRGRTMVDFSSSARFTKPASLGFGTQDRPSAQFIAGFGRPQTNLRAFRGVGVINATQLASTDFASRQNALNRVAAFAPARHGGVAPHSFIGADANGANRNRTNPASALLNHGRSQRTMAPHSLEYHLDLLPILGTGPRRALRDLWRQPGSPEAASLGYLTFTGSH